MKHTTSEHTTTRQTERASQQDATAGPNAIAIAPPAYGIGFVDRDLADAGSLSVNPPSPIQAKPMTAPPGEGNGRAGGYKKNKTGLPDQLKAGIESLSGLSMDDVRVHYNSPKPAKLQAKAYTQGTDIHVGPGQEKHLPHESWHAIQQKQGRVKPTMQMKGNVTVNDDAGLEKEADVMGAKADRTPTNISANHRFERPMTAGNNVMARGLRPIQRETGLQPGDRVRTYDGIGNIVTIYEPYYVIEFDNGVRRTIHHTLVIPTERRYAVEAKEEEEPAPRRLAVEEEEARGEEPAESRWEPYIIKFSFAGSGHFFLRTQHKEAKEPTESRKSVSDSRWKEDDPDPQKEYKPYDTGKKKKHMVTRRVEKQHVMKREKGSRRGDDKKRGYAGYEEYAFAGPGAGGGGAFDKGLHSIENDVQSAVELLDRRITELSEDLPPKQPILLLIKGHSRGGVAAATFADRIVEEQIITEDTSIELVAFDPVSGYAAKSRQQGYGALDVPGEIKSTQVIPTYNAIQPKDTKVDKFVTKRFIGDKFTPSAILGLDRLIVYAAIMDEPHHIGTHPGYTDFKYDGESYKGSKLNDLPPGVFVALKKDLILVKVTTLEDFMALVPKEKYGNIPGRIEGEDEHRQEIIEYMVQDILSRVGEQTRPR